ncbi:hypothetical protein V8B97DRAFT_2026551 [Scleroderma yunnanense]
MPSLDIFRGSKGDCDCKCFRPKADDASHCWECSHGMSKHPDTDQMMAAQAQSQLTSVLGSSNITKIFQSLTAKEPSGTCQPNPCQEALATKAVKTSKPAISKTMNTMTDECKTSFSTHCQVSGQMFHVSSVAIVTSGLNVSSTFALIHAASYSNKKGNGNLLGDTLPQSPAEKRRFIQQLEDHIFAYFDNWQEWSTTDNPQPDWQLLIPSGHGRLELCGAVCPNGVVLAHFKGHQKASVANSNLWFGIWKIVLDIVGTDIEAISDEDSDNDDNDIADLSSSIVDLKIGVMAETGKRAQPITILSSPKLINCSRWAFHKKCKNMNACAQPTWPSQSEGSITRPLSAKKVVDKDNKDALLPPNPWLSTFEQFAMGREDNISDFDL